MSKTVSVGSVGGHKMHIFTFSGTLNDGKASYGLKSMHIFIMSKIRQSQTI
jgi:hypothetical protein